MREEEKSKNLGAFRKPCRLEPLQKNCIGIRPIRLDTVNSNMLRLLVNSIIQLVLILERPMQRGSKIWLLTLTVRLSGPPPTGSGLSFLDCSTTVLPDLSWSTWILFSLDVVRHRLMPWALWWRHRSWSTDDLGMKIGLLVSLTLGFFTNRLKFV